MMIWLIVNVDLLLNVFLIKNLQKRLLPIVFLFLFVAVLR